MDFFGLDIGSHILKIAQVAKEGQRARLVAFGSAPAPAKGLLSEAESDLTALAEAIKKLHQEVGIGVKNVATALPEDKVFTTVITLPKLSEKELMSAVKWEAEQYVPLPLEEVSLDHQIVGQIKEKGTEKIEVFLVAAPKKLIEKTLRVLKAADLKPVALETEILALARGLVPPDSQTTLLVDLGAKATDLAIVAKGQVVFTRSIPTGGEALTRAIAIALNLDPSQAEAYKKAYGADPKRLEGKVREAIGPVIEAIVKEMEKAVSFYQTSKQQLIKQAILAGGTAALPEVISLLAEKLGLEIQVADPFARLEKDKEVLAKLPSGAASLYATAIGLALKEIR